MEKTLFPHLVSITKDLKVDLVSCEIIRGDRSARLGREEMGTFILLANSAELVSSEEVIRALRRKGLNKNGVYALVWRLRYKLGKLGFRRPITSIWGNQKRGTKYGYRLNLKP